MELTGMEEESPSARRRRLLRQFGKVARTSMGSVLMGTLFTFPAVVVADLQRHKTSLYGTPLNIDGLEDLVGSLLMIASLPGAWLTASLAMRLGRRKGMMLNGVIGAVGWLGLALLPSPTGILFSRCVSGMALGGLSVIINSYVAELSDVGVRGMMCTTLNLAIMIGQVFTVVLAYGVRYYTVAFINALIPAAFLLFLVWLPESPSFLVVKGKDEKAMKVLLDLRGRHANVENEVNSYKAFNKQQTNWKSLLEISVVKSLVVVTTLFCIVTCTGFLVINSFSVQLLEAAGTTVDSGLASIILMALQFAGSLAGFFLMDKLGRKKMLYLGFSLMSVALGLMAAYCGVWEGIRIIDVTTANATASTLLHNNTTSITSSITTTAGVSSGVVVARSWPEWGWLPLVLLSTSQTACSLGVNVMPFVLNQEYFPTAIRSQASGICFTAWTIANFATLQLFTPMMTTFTQAGLYAFYCAASLLGIPFTAFFIRDTTGEAVG